MAPISSDNLVQMPSSSRDVSYTDALNFFRPCRSIVHLGNKMWQKFISPSYYIFIWIISHGKLLTDAVSMRHRFFMVLQFHLCCSSLESIDISFLGTLMLASYGLLLHLIFGQLNLAFLLDLIRCALANTFNHKILDLWICVVFVVFGLFCFPGIKLLLSINGFLLIQCLLFSCVQ